MISISLETLFFTIVAVSLAAIAATAIWFARRASRTLDRYDALAPTYERVGLRAEALLAQLEVTVEEVRGVAGRASAIGANGADGMDTALGLVRQLTAVGSGLKMAVETFQNARLSRQSVNDPD